MICKPEKQPFMFMKRHVHRRIICNTTELTTTQLSTDGRIILYIVIHSHNEIVTVKINEQQPIQNIVKS